MTEPDRTRTDRHAPTVASGPAAPDGALATRGAARDAVDAQHARYGGIKWGAAFFGWLSANGLAVLLLAVLSAAGVAFGLSRVDPRTRLPSRPPPSASPAASPCSSCSSSPTLPAATWPAGWPASTAPGRAWLSG